MANDLTSIRKRYDANGSALAYPISPAEPQPADSVSQVMVSDLHYKYSNMGDPSTPNPAYDNFGAGPMNYKVPNVSQNGERARAYQEPVNRYANNLPEGAAGI